MLAEALSQQGGKSTARCKDRTDQAPALPQDWRRPVLAERGFQPGDKADTVSEAKSWLPVRIKKCRRDV